MGGYILLMAKLYNVNSKTKAYRGNVTEARVNIQFDPSIHDLDEQFIYNPRTASLIEPPTPGDSKIAVLVDSIWQLQEDHIGETWYNMDGSKVKIDMPGIYPPVNSLQIPPPSEYHETHDSTVWIENTERKEANETSTEIILEFEEDAKGSEFYMKSMAECKQYVDNQLDSATTIAQLREATKKVLKQMLPFTRVHLTR